MRLKCPQCATIVQAQPGQPVVCPSCGFSAPSPAPAADARPSLPTMSPAGMMPGPPPTILNPDHGPLGKTRKPWAPILLGLITLGVYMFVWYWKTSREVDAFARHEGHSHRPMRAGIWFYVGAILVILVAIGYAVSVFLPALEENPEQPVVDPYSLGGFVLLALLGSCLALCGLVFVAVAFWRIWKTMEQEDQRRLVPEPFNATLALVLFLMQMVPYVGFVLLFVSWYLTQSGLNRIWAAYAATPSAPPAGPA